MAAFGLAAWCRVAWTWDGAFLFFRLLQEQAPPIAHGRLSNGPPLLALLWAQRWISDIDELARLYGLLYAMFPLTALVVGLRVLPPALGHMRSWVVVGILVLPLPGQMCPTMEVTPAVQLVWPLIAFVWAGCPGRWLPAVVLLGAALFFLHPVAGPLLALVAAVAWLAARRREHPADARRDRLALLVFGGAALVRVGLTASTLDAYELEQLHPSAFTAELASGALLSPLPLVLVVVLWAALLPRGAGSRTAVVVWSTWPWVVVLVGGVWFFHDSAWWSGTLNTRKLLPLLVVPFALLATDRLRRPGPLPRGGGGLVLPCVVFAVLLGLGASSWDRELRRLERVGADRGQRVLDVREVPGLQGTPLQHWSGTVTSLLVQGRAPRWVLRAHDVRIGPDELVLWRDGDVIPLRAGHARAIDLRGLVATPPPPEPALRGP